MKLLYFMILLELAAYVQSETCPSFEGIGFYCSCDEVKDTGYIDIYCRDGNDTKDFKIFSDRLTGKKDIEMSLYKFDLDKLDLNSFNDVDVRKLELDECKIGNFVGPARFSSLENSLEVLTIKGSLFPKNDQEYLNFGHLKRLLNLEMRENSIRNLSNNWLGSGPRSLKYLNLNGNQIEYLGNSVFRKLANLEELNINSNKIFVLTRNMFPVSPDALTKLRFRSNDIRSLPENFFNGMDSLNYIEISDNKMKRMQRSTWIKVWEGLEDLEAFNNLFVCDSHMYWMLKYRLPRHFHGECRDPKEHRGIEIRNFIEDRKNSTRSVLYLHNWHVTEIYPREKYISSVYM